MNLLLFYCRLLLIIFSILFSSISCRCKNEDQQKVFTNSKTPIPLPPQDTNNLNQAIQALESEVSNPSADPKLKTIYQVIEYLPPRKFTRTADGRSSRINQEKNGRELFDKIIDNFELNETMNFSTAEAVAWLINKNLLHPNDPNAQGMIPLEKAALAWITTKFSSSTGGLVVNTLVKQGAKLTPAKSAELLEKLIETQCNLRHPREDHEAIFDFLKHQGAQLTASKASSLLEKLLNWLLDRYEPSNPWDLLNPKTLSPELLKKFIGPVKKIAQLLQEQGGKIQPDNSVGLLEKLIQKNNPLFQEVVPYIISPIPQDNIPFIESSKATTLLQEAVNKKQGAAIYNVLLDQGADPNVMVKDDLGRQMSLLHYIGGQDAQSTLFKKLVNNPKTNINITSEDPLTKVQHSVAMQKAYAKFDNTAVEILLDRQDLDLNTTESQATGTKGYTLLDIIVQNCMPNFNGGHEGQLNQGVENSKRWLITLEKVKKHPSFFVTQENIQKAQQEYAACLRRFQDRAQQKEALEIAQKALQIIEAPII